MAIVVAKGGSARALEAIKKNSAESIKRTPGLATPKRARTESVKKNSGPETGTLEFLFRVSHCIDLWAAWPPSPVPVPEPSRRAQRVKMVKMVKMVKNWFKWLKMVKNGYPFQNG